MPPGNRRDDHGERQVDHEDEPPGHGLDQPPAEERADGGAHAAETGPGSDCLAPVVGPERGLDDGQAAGRQQRRPDALERPSRDQNRPVRGRAAQGRGNREPRHAEQKDALAAVFIAKRAGKKQQASQRERISSDHPLQGGKTGVEITADGGQGNAHHRGIDRCHRGPQYRREEHPPACPAGIAQSVATAGAGLRAAHDDSGSRI